MRLPKARNFPSGQSDPVTEHHRVADGLKWKSRSRSGAIGSCVENAAESRVKIGERLVGTEPIVIPA